MKDNITENLETQTSKPKPSEVKDLVYYSKVMNYDFKNIHSLLKEVDGVNLEKVKTQFREFKESSIVSFNKRTSNVKRKFDEKIQQIKLKMKNKISALKEETKNSESQLEITGYEIPTESYSLDDMKKTFQRILVKKTKYSSLLQQPSDVNGINTNSNINNQGGFINNTGFNNLNGINGIGNYKSINDACVSEVESIIGIIKKLSDNEKIMKVYRSMESIIYWRYLNDKREMISSIVLDKQNEVLKKIQEEFVEMSSNFIQPKETGNYTMPQYCYFNTYPKNIKTEIVISDTCQKAYTIDSVFCAFTTADQSPYLAWSNSSNSVEVYCLTKEKILQSLKQHSHHIYIVRHFYDKRFTEDFLLSTSYDKKAIVWKYNSESKQFALSLCINTGHAGLYLYSGLILFDYTSDKPQLDSSIVITSVPNEQLKVFNFKGTLLRHIGNKSDYTYFINSYFEAKKNAFYIINANSQDIKIFDLKEGITSKIFKDEASTWHMSAFITELNETTYLFESDGNGVIRIWNYETVKIFKKMSVASCSLRGIVLWNEKYIVAASSDKSFKFFNIEECSLEYSLTCHENVLCSIQKIIHPKYGECLITSAIDGKLKLFCV